MIKVMFVCHGNICRSPMAEFVLKDMVRKLGKEEKFLIESSATSSEEIGSDTHRGTLQKLKEVGIKSTKRRAKKFTKENYMEFDYIICMDDNNLRNIKRIILDTDSKICKLLNYANSNKDIADPWYTGNFDETYDDIVNGCTCFLSQISENK